MLVFEGLKGAALVALAFGLAFQQASGRLRRTLLRSGALGSALLLVGLTLWTRSGKGRWLGIAEAAWMGVTTDFRGAGWGQWSWRQAEAQRAILIGFPFPSWKEIAPYFGVAPSLPAHLFAELGIAGLGAWTLLLVVAFAGLIRLRAARPRALSAALAAALIVSAGTTPVQALLSVDREKVLSCDRAIRAYDEGAEPYQAIEERCPEIRALEWKGSALEAEGTIEDAKRAYFDWHRTFPKDVMPPYALGRLAVRSGQPERALNWFRIAAQGNPGRDGAAAALRDRARRIVDGDSDLLEVWRPKSPKDF